MEVGQAMCSGLDLINSACEHYRSRVKWMSAFLRIDRVACRKQATVMLPALHQKALKHMENGNV